MTYYLAIVDGKPGAYGVRFPDCPGAFGAGDTIEDAVANATEGLSVWAIAALKDGDALPAPRSAVDIQASDDAAQAGETIALLPLLIETGRTVKANVTFDAWLLDAIDAEAQRRGITRSAFLASAARQKITSAR